MNDVARWSMAWDALPSERRRGYAGSAALEQASA
jgi:hypothetical protein